MSAFAFDQNDDWDDTPETELLRAQLYALLAHLLVMPPKMELLLTLQNLAGDSSALGKCFTTISLTARRMSPVMIKHEHHQLFHPENSGYVRPHQSEYHTCSATPIDQCLQDLQEDLHKSHIIAPAHTGFRPDHAGLLLELMAGMISGAFGRVIDLDEQQYYFEKYIASWMPLFFQKLETSEIAAFYMPVATLGKEFLEIEKQAFEIGS